MADDIAEAVASPAKRYAAPVIEERDYTQEALAQYGLKEAHIASITPSKDKKKSDLRSATPVSTYIISQCKLDRGLRFMLRCNFLKWIFRFFLFA